jgi:acetyl esterase/lipase
MSLADLDDEVRAFIAKSESFYPASANEASPAENRAIYDRMCAAFDRPRPPGLVVTDETLSATDPARTLPIRRYRPPSAPRGRLVASWLAVCTAMMASAPNSPPRRSMNWSP